ncbi:hypothetical protein ACWT_4358 [Actinoplanes sp. SE50]|uniref:hypothetical protein n=1 Tax=Actinoplanes sp. (strain ATCC 31044 / CBS 674.73 / SE50/110) TaxID=134676 RepID=UPI00023EC9A0|nr:hypothetical protein [Actinoplanes sp. SE50/110]AEV85378.1 hypothetical protein ACPL_4487 [Actinoplanes sp. SE50/110]ATO83773.1 hypothetical protein ACWT_4358 [Actinoplanes sp. SE50]SLM01181.1 hypothetical protein ACSP50_4414 [Actinoplanes sp. SE50/110]
MPIDPSKAPASTSPLWIIALFIVLSEVMAGVASIATDGATRIIFAVFAVGFPLIVFAVFSYLLVGHTAKLYAPSQYSVDIDPERFAVGVNAGGFTQPQVTLIAEAVAQAIEQSEPASHGDANVASRAVEVFRQTIFQSSVAVDLDGIGDGGSDGLVIPVDRGTGVDDFLDQVWFAMRGRFRAFTYGKDWVLVDDENRKEFREAGTAWAQKHGETRDRRPLSEIGISPGSNLRVVAL